MHSGFNQNENVASAEMKEEAELCASGGVLTGEPVGSGLKRYGKGVQQISSAPHRRPFLSCRFFFSPPLLLELATLAHLSVSD